MAQPLIVGIGGSTRADSSSERLLRACMAEATRLGADTRVIGGAMLRVPLYEAEDPARPRAAVELVDAVREADGLIIASPGYHGGISGLMKNALDYVEDLREDERPYLDGRAVGCVACASGWQATGSTLQALRAVVHALRGWPTPLGVAVNTELPLWAPDGGLGDRAVAAQIEVMVSQVVDFARRFGMVRTSTDGARAAG